MSRNSTPLLTLTLTLSGTVAQSRFVTPAGAQTVADGNAIGVSRVAGVTGEKIPVDTIGTSVVETGGAFAAGVTLKSDASGRAIQWATSGARTAISLEASGAAGQFVEVRLLSNAL